MKELLAVKNTTPFKGILNLHSAVNHFGFDEVLGFILHSTIERLLEIKTYFPAKNTFERFKVLT